MLVIDSVLITGSLLALTWPTVFDPRRSGTRGQSRLVVGVLAAYPIADVMLATMVVAAARPPGRSRGRAAPAASGRRAACWRSASPTCCGWCT